MIGAILFMADIGSEARSLRIRFEAFSSLMNHYHYETIMLNARMTWDHVSSPTQ